jgi:hypothetical protein
MSATFIIPLTISLAVYTSSNVKTNTSTLEEALLTKGNTLAREGAASLAFVGEPFAAQTIRSGKSKVL